MFNLKEFILNNLIKGVKNGTFTKEYASILATNYYIKGILNEQDLARFDEETREEEVEIPVDTTAEETAENAENSVESEE